MNIRKRLVLAWSVAVLAAVMVGGIASADPSRATKGDAQAVFVALDGGGMAVRLHSPVAIGAPADSLRVSIRPFETFDGHHYCALDWHTIVLGFVDGSQADYPVTLRDVQAEVAQLEVDFTLDGAPLDTDRTSVKRFLNPDRYGWLDAWGANFGRVMAPEDLAPGTHTLSVNITGPSFPGGFNDGITFSIDPAGTPACA